MKLIAAIGTAFTIFFSTAGLAAPAEEKDSWGVFARLADRTWKASDGSLMHYSWKSPGQILVMEWAKGTETYVRQYRLSLDGQKILSFEGPELQDRRSVKLIRSDAYASYDLNDNFLGGCWLEAKTSALICEKAGTADLDNWTAVNNEIFFNKKQISSNNVSKNQAEVNSRIAAIKKRWGVFVEGNALEIRRNEILYKKRDFFVKLQRPGSKNRELLASIYWKNDQKRGFSMVESYVDLDPAIGWYGWWLWYVDPKTNQIMRRYGGDAEADVVSFNSDGTVQSKLRYGEAYGKKNVTINATSVGLDFVGRGNDGEITWQQTLTQVETGEYKRAYDGLMLAKQKNKNNGSGGIGGILMGAALGGALSGGSAEGIVAGARVLGTKDGAQQVYNEYESKREANEREAARSEAAFQASMRALQTSNAKPSNASPTTQPATSSVNPVSAQNSAVSGNAATQNTGSTSKGSGNAAKSFPNRPLQFILYVVPLLKDSDVSQPQCLSNVITVNGPPSWSSASRDGHEADLIIDRYKERFVQSCGRARGTGAASARTVSYINNYHEGVDVDEEYANRAAIRNTTLVDIQP
ncbi:hypothetical protein [Parasphingorhabdus sp.]|uniref:hypothetical protein n=1 Tax=Parasphingorhabdus sp. TaxID=2709688 RepID=UPI00300208DE